MKTLMISDMHLEEGRPEMTEIFLRFLQTELNSADALYILGDFFEVWLGEDDRTPFNLKIMAALKQVTQQGLPVYLMFGNRDFLYGKKFFKETGCVRLPDEKVINLYGTPTLLMHGDTLCTEDVRYQKFRKKIRSRLGVRLLLLTPLPGRKWIARKIRSASKAHTSTTAEYITDVTQSEVENVMRKHSVTRLIHGHTHRPGVHHFHLDNQPATRTVLGAWHDYGNVLICNSDGSNELKILS